MPEEIACNSGVLMIISEARLISDDLIGTDAVLGGEKTCFSGDVESAGVARAVCPAIG